MSTTFYRTKNGAPPYGGKPPAPKEAPNPNLRFCTVDGHAPYGGLPPNKRPPRPEGPPASIVATNIIYHPYPGYQLAAPPTSAPEPSFSSPPPEYRAITYCPRECSPPPRYKLIEAPPAPQKEVRFEAPGRELYGRTPDFGSGANFSYIFPSTHVSIQYWDDGFQPWLPGGGSPLVSRRVVPACMRIKDLIKQLGAKDGDDGRKYGLTVAKLHVIQPDGGKKDFMDIEEGIREIKRGGRHWKWIKGKTYTLGDEKNKTLEELKWSGVVGVAISVG